MDPLSSIIMQAGSGRTIPPLNAEMDRDDYAQWEKADGRTNGNPFNVGWRADHATVKDGLLTLQLDNNNCPQACSSRPYASGEYRTINTYGYGRFEGRLKAVKGDGLVTSFFTFYAPPTDNYIYNDEIDIEILGKDTTQMQINYHNDATTGIDHPGGRLNKMIPLGFDASQDFHNYAIEWTPQAISWFVDGRLVHSENGSRGVIPTKPGQIMLNLWPGIGVDSWLRPFKYTGPVKAEYDWIRFTPLGGTAQPVSALPAGPAPQTATPVLAAPVPLAALPLSDHPFLPRPDTGIGQVQYDGRPLLNEALLDKKIGLPTGKQDPFDQLELVLKAIAGQPADHVVSTKVSWENIEQLDRYYPELKAIREIDSHYDNKFYWYFFDPKAYWENSISLLSLYVQKSLERSQQSKMGDALAVVASFRARLATQELADQAAVSATPCSPSNYKLATLDLEEAEIRSLTPGQDKAFYLAGIGLVMSGIHAILALQSSKIYPSKPDYFNIFKGLLTLGELNQQLGNLTHEAKYFEAADRFFRSLIDLDEKANKGLKLEIPGTAEWLAVTLNVEPKEIEAALTFNRDNGYLKAADIKKSKNGIYHYLPGIALIKAVGLFAAWPKEKTPVELLDRFDLVERGLDQLKTAAARAGESEAKNRYFYELAKPIQGELLLALADRLSSYPDDPEQHRRLEAIVGHKLSREAQQRASELIIFAGNKYFQGVPEFTYLAALKRVKQLELAVRSADYVVKLPKGKALDAAGQLQTIRDNRESIQQAYAGQATPSYLKVEFEYLETILLLAGEVLRDVHGNPVWETLRTGSNYRKVVFTEQVIPLIERLKQDLTALSPESAVYFDINTGLKEASAMIQFARAKKQTDGQKQLVGAYILGQTGKTDKALEALTVTLPKLLAQSPLNMKEITAITKVVAVFIDEKIKEPKARQALQERLKSLTAHVAQKNAAAAQADLKQLAGQFAALNAKPDEFEKKYARLLAWDMHALRAELYDAMATLYAIRGEKTREGSVEGQLAYQYAQSAYLESQRSSYLYDYQERSYFIYKNTHDAPNRPAAGLPVDPADQALLEKAAVIINGGKAGKAKP